MYDGLTYEDKMCLITDYMSGLSNKKQREFYDNIANEKPMVNLVDDVLNKIDRFKEQNDSGKMDLQDT